MEIDQRIILGISLIAMMIAVFAYKEILDVKSIMMGTPTPTSYDTMLDAMYPDDDQEECDVQPTEKEESI